MLIQIFIKVEHFGSNNTLVHAGDDGHFFFCLTSIFFFLDEYKLQKYLNIIHLKFIFYIFSFRYACKTSSITSCLLKDSMTYLFMLHLASRGAQVACSYACRVKKRNTHERRGCKYGFSWTCPILNRQTIL